MATKNDAPLLIADSSALVSLVSVSDRNNHHALSVSQKLIDLSGTIIVPGDVFTETVNVLGKKASHALATDAAHELLRSTPFLVIETDSVIRTLALNKFQKQPSSVSFTDCLVMAFADFYNTREIFGFDECFRKNGYLLPGLKEA